MKEEFLNRKGMSKLYRFILHIMVYLLEKQPRFQRVDSLRAMHKMYFLSIAVEYLTVISSLALNIVFLMLSKNFKENVKIIIDSLV